MSTWSYDGLVGVVFAELLPLRFISPEKNDASASFSDFPSAAIAGEGVSDFLLASRS